MSDYKYRCPTAYGYKKIKLTRKEHKQYFGKKKWHERFEYYLKDNCVKANVFTNVLGLIYATLISPIMGFVISICYGSSRGFKDVYDELTSLFNQKESGRFHNRYYYFKE